MSIALYLDVNNSRNHSKINYVIINNEMNNEEYYFDGSGFAFIFKFTFSVIAVFTIFTYGSRYAIDQWVNEEINTYNQITQSSQERVRMIQANLASLPKIPVFNPSLLTWSLATSSAAWYPRDSAASFVFQDKMWTLGGINGSKKINNKNKVIYWEAPHFSDIWNSEDGINWKLVKAKAPWAVRRSMSVAVFNDKLWMLGGWSPVTGYSKDIWQSTDGISWKKVISSAPWSAREGQVLRVFQDKLWMIGGVNYDDRAVKNDVWFSEDGLRWKRATSTIPWGGRWDHDVEIFNDKMYLVGGMNLSGKTFKDVWVSEDGIEWNLVTNNPPWESRQGHSLVSYKERLWIIGRLNDKEAKGVNDVWFSKDGVDWEKTKVDPEWTGREDHSVLILNDKMYLFGGMDADWKWKNDVWVTD
jgi:hypothetical protein